MIEAVVRLTDRSKQKEIISTLCIVNFEKVG